MLKVECESCKAPYQIDERRIPPAGLKMRCPKCGTSFFVANPNATDLPAIKADLPAVRADLPAVKADLPAPKADLPAVKAAKPAGPPPKGPPRPPLAKPAPPSPPKVAPPIVSQKPPVKPTLPSASQQSLPSDFPAVLGGASQRDVSPMSLDLDLPIPASKGAAREADLPALSLGEVDLPAAKGQYEIDLPAISQRAAGIADRDLPVSKGGELDLPTVVPDAVGLPVIAAALPAVAQGPASDFGEVDLGGVEIESFRPRAPSLPDPAEMAAKKASAGSVAVASPFEEKEAPSFSKGGFDIDLAIPERPSLPGRASLGGAAVVPPSNPFAVPHSLGAPPMGGPASIRGPASLGSPPASFEAVDASLSSRGEDERTSFGALDFGELDTSTEAQSAEAPAEIHHGRGETRAGGLGFGEVDLGGEDEAATSAAPLADPIGMEAPIPQEPDLPEEGAKESDNTLRGAANFEAPLPLAPIKGVQDKGTTAKTKSRAKKVLGAAAVVAFLGGVSLQLTPHGAFAYLTVSDLARAGTYDKASAQALKETKERLLRDDFADSKARVEELARLRATFPRAKQVSTLAAFVEATHALRFGADTLGPLRGKGWLLEIPQGVEVKYLAAAQGAQAAAAEDWDKAKKGLEAGTRKDVGDPIQTEIALLRGEVELRTHDAKAALAYFQKVGPSDARASYGLARAHRQLGDAAAAKKEVEATLSIAKDHAGALTLRAMLAAEGGRDDREALADLERVMAQKDKIAPRDLAEAHAAKGWIELSRGGIAEARTLFESAVKLNQRSVLALFGQGELLLREGRPTEALSRFAAALSVDPTVVELIVADARAKVQVERLQDAKAQLTAASTRYPDAVAILMALGEVEKSLGNMAQAEKLLRQATAKVDPQSRDAAQPYVALARLLSSLGKTSEAKAALEEAKAKLPGVAELVRAFGELSELEGNYPSAIAYYEKALEQNPKDTVTQFRLAVALRRVQRYEEAARAFDAVEKRDKDFPGLALERGLLFEQSGQVERAIAEFKAALSKAPQDLDLQLRVASAYVAVGRSEDALPMLKAIVEKRGASAEAQHYLGRALMLSGSGSEVQALKHLKRAVELDPNRAEYHAYLAWAANEAIPPQLALAKTSVDKAFELDKLNAEAFWQRGVLNRKQSAVKDAIDDLKRALELRPTRYEAHAALAECYEDKANFSEATAEWQKAVAADGRRPYWRYKLGMRLLDVGKAADALSHLEYAVTEGGKVEPRLVWITPAHFLLAESARKSGRKDVAVTHYRKFLEVASQNSPDRKDAERELRGLTGER